MGAWFVAAAAVLATGNDPGPIARAAARFGGGLIPPAPASRFDSRQPVTSVWSDAIHTLPRNADVRVTLDMGPVRGWFRGGDDHSVTLDVAGTTVRLSRADVVRMSINDGTSRKRRERIGLAIGVTVGAWIWNRQCGKARDNCQEDTMAYFGGPMLAGGLLGHALPAGQVWRDIYIRR